MAYAADLKSVGRKVLWVRPPPPVPANVDDRFRDRSARIRSTLLCRSPHLRDDIASAVMFAGKRSTTMGDKSPKNTAKTKKQKGAKAAAPKAGAKK